MSPLARAEKYRLSIGVVSGAVTAILVLAIWFVRGGAAVDPDADDALTAPDSVVGPVVARAGTGPIIGAFHRGVEGRLRSTDPVVRPVSRLSVTARDLVWHEPDGRVFARAARASAVVDAAAAARRDIVLDDLVLSDGRLWLREEGERWNYEVVLAELLEDDPDGTDDPGRLVLLRGTRFVDAVVQVDRPTGAFVLRDLDARLPAIWLADPRRSAVEMLIASGTATLDMPEREPIVLAAQDAIIALPEDVVTFTIERLRIDGAQLAGIEGTWNPAWPFPGLDARGRALDVPMAELARYAPDRLPEDGAATFDWQLRPVDDARIEVAVSDLSLATGESRISGSASFRLGGPRPELHAADLVLDPLQLALLESVAGRSLPYLGRITGTVRGSAGIIDFDGRAALAASDAPADTFSTAVRARIEMTGDGIRLAGAEAELNAVPLSSLRAFIPGLPLSGTLDGTVVLEGSPGRTPLSLDLQLRSGFGLVTGTGVVDLTGAEPTYALSGRMVGLELAELLEPDVPPVALTGTFAVEGSGVQPDSAHTRIDVAGRFTGWESRAGDTLDVRAQLRDGAVALESARVELATLTLDVAGTWQIREPGGGSLRYAVDVGSLEPWAPYLPGPAAGAGSGTVAVAGTLAGSVEAPRVDGELTARELQLSDWHFGALDARFAVVVHDTLPEVVVAARATAIETATAGALDSAALELTLSPPALELTLRAERTGGGVLELAADGSVPRTGLRQVTLREAVVDIEGGRWQLSEPSVIRWNEAATVEGLELVEPGSGGRVFLAGTVWPLDELDAELDIAALPLGDLQALLGLAPQATGRLGVQGSIRVEEGAPTALLAFQLDSAVVRRVPIPSMVGALRYQDGLVEGRALAALDTAGRVAMELQLPAEAAVDSTPYFRLVREGVVSGRLVAQDLALAALAEATPYVRDVEGRINGEVALGGTVAAPELGGRMIVTDGAATLVPIDQRYTRITADVGLADRRLTINSLHAYSGGSLTVTGAVVFETLAEPVADLAVSAQAFRAIGVPNQEDAAFGGTLTVRGPIPSVVVSGALSVSDGYVPIPEPSGPEADFPELPGTGTAIETRWSDAISIDALTLDVANDVWFSGAGVRAQLSGQLSVSKSRDAVHVQGTLEGVRGTYTLRAGPIIRQFEIASAQVRFLGSPQPDPALDITARRIVLDPAGRRIEIDVRIGGRLSNPTLSLASPDLATVPESELLSFLFFGRPSFDLGGGGLPGEVILQETLVGGFAEFAGLQLERALVEDLGLSFDLFQIRFGGTTASRGYGADVVLGWELGSEFFLTVESALGALIEGGGGPNIWAIRLEWAFADDSQARIGLEPVRLTRYLRGFSLGVDPARLQQEQQFFLEVRRRWTY